MPNDSATDFIASLLAEVDKQPKIKKKRTVKSPSQLVINTPANRLLSTNWKDEAIILLITHAYCISCKRIHTAPNAYPMLRRWHPSWGIHEEALGLRPSTDLMRELPHRLEERTIETPCCHICFGLGGQLTTGQLMLDFTEADITNGTPILLGEST